MIHLLLSIASTTAILVLFKSVRRFKNDLFYVIIINYAIAFLLGLGLSRQPAGFSGGGSNIIDAPWLYLSILVGICLIAMFFVIGITTQKAGISVAGIAGKISVVIPMLFSILYYHEPLSRLKAAGIGLALFALALSVVKKGPQGINRQTIYLPVILFLGLGCLDVLVKFVQEEHITDDTAALFTGASFLFAFITGLIICIVKKAAFARFFHPPVLSAGILLGLFNFGSMFFLINALNSGVFDSSILFGINNIAVVGLSVLIAFIVFKEPLSLVNWVGVSLSIAAISIFIHA